MTLGGSYFCEPQQQEPAPSPPEGGPIATSSTAPTSTAPTNEFDQLRREFADRIAATEAKHAELEAKHTKQTAKLIDEVARLRMTCAFLAGKEGANDVAEACDAIADIPVVGPAISAGCMPLLQIGGALLATPVIGSGPEKVLYKIVLALAIAFSMLSVVTGAIDMVTSREAVTSFDITYESPFVLPEFEVRHDLLLSNRPPLTHMVYAMGSLNNTKETATTSSWSNIFCSTCNGIPASTRLPTAYYSTSEQPDINVVEETGKWIPADFNMNATDLRYPQNMYNDDVVVELCATGKLGPYSDFLCDISTKAWSISSEPDVSQFLPTSTKDIMGQVFYMSMGFYIPQGNVTRSQYETWDYAMYEMSGLAASVLFGNWSEWQNIFSTPLKTNSSSTVGEVMIEMLQGYRPLMKSSITLADGCVFPRFPTRVSAVYNECGSLARSSQHNLQHRSVRNISRRLQQKQVAQGDRSAIRLAVGSFIRWQRAGYRDP